MCRECHILHLGWRLCGILHYYKLPPDGGPLIQKVMILPHSAGLHYDFFKYAAFSPCKWRKKNKKESTILFLH